MNSAGSTLTGIATNMGARKTKLVADEFYQQGAGLNLASFLFSINRERYFHRICARFFAVGGVFSRR